MPNKERLEQLHADYYAMVHQMCMGFVKGDKDMANDLAQEVFINTWSALDKFKGDSSYKTWIYRITVNTCLKYKRDLKNKQLVTFEERHDEIVKPADVEVPYQSLYMAIGKLNEVDRLIIMMVLDELDYNEIAQVIGISEGTLRVKIHRIKKNIKKILDHE